MMTTETPVDEQLTAELIVPSSATRLPAAMPQPRAAKPRRWRRWFAIAAATLVALTLAFGAGRWLL
jgi:hypothetical protein